MIDIGAAVRMATLGRRRRDCLADERSARARRARAEVTVAVNVVKRLTSCASGSKSLTRTWKRSIEASTGVSAVGVKLRHGVVDEAAAGG